MHHSVEQRPPRCFPAAMYGLLLCVLSAPLYALAGFLEILALWRTVVENSTLTATTAVVLTVAFLFTVIGIGLMVVDLKILSPKRRGNRSVRESEPESNLMTVVLTAYNDELSVGNAVEDFVRHDNVQRVIVINNNSIDATSERARAAGAIVLKEKRQGYGWAVFRALSEAARFTDTSLILLCEGDMTFRARDSEKLLAYISHGDIINGTRIVEQLRQPETQLSEFMYWGNFVAAKVLELKHLGRGTITDLGTTYKLCRSEYIRELLPHLDPRVNLEFNAHFIDTVMGSHGCFVEVPITFWKRVGVSKGGNVSNFRALKVGLRMLLGIVVSWKLARFVA